MVNWCNRNQGFLMVILTCIYVIATITICFFNYKAIAEQRNISQQQKKVSTFSLRYESYLYILQELHFWRFSNNDQVELFFGMKTKVDVSLLLASHCQNFFNVITSADLVFGKDVDQRLNEAWQIIKDKIYPYLKEITSQVSPETLPVDILILIKYKMREVPISQYIDRLFALEAEVSSIIQEKVGIQNI